MESTESDVGYPEEQPPAVDDTPAEGQPQRSGGSPSEAGREGEGGGPQTDNDDGTATGNPASAGETAPPDADLGPEGKQANQGSPGPVPVREQGGL
jgi:hypothetical protein